VLDFWRCAMIPLRDPDVQTAHADRFEGISQELDLARVEEAVPADWRFDLFRESVPGEHFADLEEGAVYEVEGRDTVTGAPELARLSLNVAQAHTDAGATAHGKRLVYGGHTIGIAAAQATRAIPNLMTILAWRSCDHLGPVFEGDVLSTELSVEGVRPLDDGGLVELRAATSADRGEVLDWRFVGLMA
jgi:acyl dehydratase